MEYRHSPSTVLRRYPFLLPLARAIVAILGRRSEVVIHDLTNPSALNSTIVALEGNVTGRQIGGPPTDYLLNCLHGGGRVEALEAFAVYAGRTADGRPLRSATVLLQDADETVIGALCVNVEVTDLLMARAVLDDLCLGALHQLETERPRETFANDAEQTFDAIMQAALREIGKPVGYMDKQDRVQLVKLVDAKGGFLLRGAADRLAKALGVSRGTVYNYLSENRQPETEPAWTG